MITTYSSRDYRITYQGISLVENALERPDLVQVSVVSGCIIQVAPQKDYGIDYQPNGEYRAWYMEGVNTKLARAEAHYIYARLNRDDTNALLLFSVNDYDIDGKISGQGEASEDYYYIKIGEISATDSATNPTLDREITIDFGYLTTPAGQDDTSGWKELFEVTAEGLIRPLKKFTSYIVQGTLNVIGKIVLNEKQVSDISREGDKEEFTESDEALPTTKLLKGKYLDELRKVLLNKDREDTTNYLLNLLGGVISPFIQSPDFISGPMGAGLTLKQNADGKTYAEVDKLLVRMKAIFQTLSIMETELAGASFLFNATGARIKVTKVERIDATPVFYTDRVAMRYADGKRAYVQPSNYGAVYRCYFLADDGETAIENRFKVGNLARSQSFNIKAGIHENVSNHYYWRLVTAVGDNWIDLSVSHCDEGSDIPKEGDVIVQLGDLTDPDYQSAAVLSAYGDSAPYLTFYQGINSYSLSEKDTFSVGYDRALQECFVNVHGRIYIGDRAKKNYISFSPSDGLRLKVKEILTEAGEDVISMIAAVEGQISLKVGKDELSSAGMTITNNQIKFNANKLVIADNSGNNPVAVFTWTNGRPLLNAENIDADNLTARKLATTNGKIQLNPDGSGKLANGNIDWNTNGDITLNGTLLQPFTTMTGMGMGGSNTMKWYIEGAFNLKMRNNYIVKTESGIFNYTEDLDINDIKLNGLQIGILNAGSGDLIVRTKSDKQLTTISPNTYMQFVYVCVSDLNGWIFYGVFTPL